MTKPPLPVQKNYEISRERAVAALSGESPAAIAGRTGGVLSDGGVSVRFFRWTAVYDPAAGALSLPQDIQTKSTENLILHYLAYAKGLPPRGEWINFYQIKDAALYLPVFNKRTIAIVGKRVKNEADFVAKCGLLGGEPVDFTASARAFRFSAFPNVPLLLVYYEGDEEIASEIKYMFDSSIVHNLSAEDVVVTTQFLSLQFFKV